VPTVFVGSFLHGYVKKRQGFEFDCGISRKFDVYSQPGSPEVEIKQQLIPECCDSIDYC
jgi:hypothetical protein